MQVPPLRYNHPNELRSSGTPDFAPVGMTAGVDDDHVVAIGILRCGQNDNMVNARFCTVEVKERSSFWQALWFHSQEWSVPEVHGIDMNKGEESMLDNRFAKIIEGHSEELAAGLVRLLQKSERTSAYRNIPSNTLERQLRDVYQNLSLWLMTKTEADIQERYSEIGRRRAEMGIPVDQFALALIMSKEHLWHYLRSENIADQAMHLLSEMDFLLFLDRFFDRALYFGLRSYNEVLSKQAA